MDLNGITDLCITKVDVLTGLAEINVAIAYKNKKTGEILDVYPTDTSVLYNCEPVYEKLPGWTGASSDSFSRDSVPLQFKNFVALIDRSLSPARVSLVSFGPGRESFMQWSGDHMTNNSEHS